MAAEVGGGSGEPLAPVTLLRAAFYDSPVLLRRISKCKRKRQAVSFTRVNFNCHMFSLSALNLVLEYDHCSCFIARISSATQDVVLVQVHLETSLRVHCVMYLTHLTLCPSK